MSGAIWFGKSEYDYWEVISALQKAIRRGLEDESLFWGTELWLGGAAAHAWNRLLIIASEDVGLASDVHLAIKSLRESWKDLPKESKDKEGRLYFVHAILLLVRSPKSRLVDHATITFFEGERSKRPIPDYALDMHTRRGKELGRGVDHFFDEGAVLGNCSVDDPYRDKAKAIRKSNKIGDQQTQEDD